MPDCRPPERCLAGPAPGRGPPVAVARWRGGLCWFMSGLGQAVGGGGGWRRSRDLGCQARRDQFYQFRGPACAGSGAQALLHLLAVARRQRLDGLGDGPGGLFEYPPRGRVEMPGQLRPGRGRGVGGKCRDKPGKQVRAGAVVDFADGFSGVRGRSFRGGDRLLGDDRVWLWFVLQRGNGWLGQADCGCHHCGQSDRFRRRLPCHRHWRGRAPRLRLRHGFLGGFHIGRLGRMIRPGRGGHRVFRRATGPCPDRRPDHLGNRVVTEPCLQRLRLSVAGGHLRSGHFAAAVNRTWHAGLVPVGFAFFPAVGLCDIVYRPEPPEIVHAAPPPATRRSA